MATSVHELLQERADYNARLRLIPYDGTVEIKKNESGSYLYIRKREQGKLKSLYVDRYTDEVYEFLMRTTKEAKAIRRTIKRIERELAALGYEDVSLKADIILNIDFARAHLYKNIYDQAILEGIGTTFPQTENILENGEVVGAKAQDVQKILNLKHAWEFILDKDILVYRDIYAILCNIARLVNEGIYRSGGTIRRLPVAIGGSTYVPPIPEEDKVKDELKEIIARDSDAVEKAIELCLYCMKTQIFIDGNKRAAVILANYYLISQGKGLLVVPEAKVPEFKKLLVRYYEGNDCGEIWRFMREYCLKLMYNKD